MKHNQLLWLYLNVLAILRGLLQSSPMATEVTSRRVRGALGSLNSTEAAAVRRMAIRPAEFHL